jgi:hypothetical protein
LARGIALLLVLTLRGIVIGLTLDLPSARAFHGGLARENFTFPAYLRQFTAIYGFLGGTRANAGAESVKDANEHGRTQKDEHE